MVPVPPTDALVTLVRFAYSPNGTFGRISVDGGAPFYTVEQPWADNVVGHSCIPCGTYPLKLGMFFGGDGIGGKPDYPAYEVLNVPGRTLIKIHRANKADDVQGCIGPGMTLGVAGTTWAVLQSAVAFAHFMELMAQRDGTITVSNYTGGIL